MDALAHVEAWLAGRLLGSVPANVARRSKTDVLIVHTTPGRALSTRSLRDLADRRFQRYADTVKVTDIHPPTDETTPVPGGTLHKTDHATLTERSDDYQIDEEHSAITSGDARRTPALRTVTSSPRSVSSA